MSEALRMFEDPTPPVPPGVDLRCADVGEVLPTVSGASLVVADPPWSYRNGQNGRAAEHYDLLPLERILEHVDGAWDAAADDAYLLLWVTFPCLAEWMEVHGGLRWRFLSGGAWVKTGQVGVGYHWRGEAEPVLLYGKGRPRPHAMARSGYTARRPACAGNSATNHSEKPQPWAHDHVRAFCPPDGLVLDVYAGMAPYARACALEGRRYVGAEIDPDRHRRALGLLAGAVSRGGVR